MKKIIYLDSASTTKVYRQVIDEMKPYFSDKYGNPSSPYSFGEEALLSLNSARKAIADFIGAKPSEIIFTSGATESNNLAIIGLSRAFPKKRKMIISSFEHSSVYSVSGYLRNLGYKIIEIPVSKEGFLDLNRLEKSIDSDTLLVSIIYAHNELGVLQDIEKIGKICKERKTFFHTDAVQIFGKEKINVKSMNIGLLSASAHKIGGPKGIGLLYVKDGIKIEPIILGGGQERGRRGGTENVPGIIGFAKAIEINSKIKKGRILSVRNYFMEELEKIGGRINCSKKNRIYNNIHVSFSGADAEMLVLYLSQNNIMCSAKSACSTKEKEDNRNLKAIGLKKEDMIGSLRFTLSKDSKKRDIDYCIARIKDFLSRYSKSQLP